jgi:hypothetical protein
MYGTLTIFSTFESEMKLIYRFFHQYARCKEENVCHANATYTFAFPRYARAEWSSRIAEFISEYRGTIQQIKGTSTTMYIMNINTEPNCNTSATFTIYH